MNRKVILFTACFLVVLLAQNSQTLAKLYPSGSIFCFTFYSTKNTDSLHSLQNGATAIGPYYNNQEDDLARAVALNTHFIYKVNLPSMAGANAASFDDGSFVWPDDQTIINEATAAVNAVKDNPHIAFWDIVPEELRHWKPKEVHYLNLVASAIRAADPNDRPVYMYEPNHRNANDLMRTLPFQDLCAKGMYVNTVNNGAFIHNRVFARWSMEQELEAIAAANPSATPWIVLWMAGDAPIEDFHLIDDWCRHDAYMGLIMGGKGIQIWSGFRGRTGFSNSHFDAYLDGYLSVANDLNGPLNLAPVFLFGQKQNDVVMNITSGPDRLQLDYDNQTFFYPPLTYLNTIHNDTEYLFVVNSAETAVTATFSGLPESARKDLFAGGTLATPGGTFSEELPALTVKGYRFSGNIPTFTSDPIVETDAAANASYHGTIGDDVTGSSDALLAFTKISGPDWLSIATDGELSGIPTIADFGVNNWIVQVSNDTGGTDTATLSIEVYPSLCSTSLLSFNFDDPDHDTLPELQTQNWNFGGEMTSNGQSEESIVTKTNNEKVLKLDAGAVGDSLPFGSIYPQASCDWGISVDKGKLVYRYENSNSFSNTCMRILDGTTELFQIKMVSDTRITINGNSVQIVDIQDNTGFPVTITVFWDATIGVFNYSIDESHSGGTLHEDENGFIASGSPTGLKCELTSPTHFSREWYLYEIRVDDTRCDPDTTPPTPNPIAWATMPHATGKNSIAMTATMGIDPSGVEYYFDNTAGEGHDSGWQTSPIYEDNGLLPGKTYDYTVTARDLSLNHNQTLVSTVASATTFHASDVNSNGETNIEDLLITITQWLQPPGVPSADTMPLPDGDGIVDLVDFSILALYWLY